MLKLSDLFKLFLVIQIVSFSCALPIGDEFSYDNGVSVKKFIKRMKEITKLTDGLLHSMIRTLLDGFPSELHTSDRQITNQIKIIRLTTSDQKHGLWRLQSEIQN